MHAMHTERQPAGKSPRLNVVITSSIEAGLARAGVVLTAKNDRAFAPPVAAREVMRLGLRALGIEVSEAEPGEEATAPRVDTSKLATSIKGPAGLATKKTGPKKAKVRK